jgi:hypothetical protein
MDAVQRETRSFRARCTGRASGDAIKAFLAPAQMPLALDAGPPQSFLDRESDRFDVLLAEFGIAVPVELERPRRAAA